MARRVVLHIGAMKSGTSFIQAVCDNNREVLSQHGVLFVGEKWGDQVTAVEELIEADLEAPEPFRADGPWQRLVAAVDAWPDTVVISMEFLAPRGVPKIEFLRDAFAGADVHVVLTARDLGRNIPAMWVELMQNRGTVTWEEFRDQIGKPWRRAEPPEHTRWFWRHQDIAGMVERWQSVMGPERFTLITVPHPGTPRDLLWTRFNEILGVPDGICDLGVSGNPSIGAIAATLLRRLNATMQHDQISKIAYNHRVKRTLAKEGLGSRIEDRQTMEFKASWARRLAKRQIADIRALRPHVIGDLAELEAVPVAGLRSVPVEAQLEAAVEAMDILVTKWTGEAKGLRLQLRRARRRRA